jgi:phosphoribosylformylglycinamidine synthase subunit PurS
MSGFLARVYVTPKPSVRDPEGATILDGLHQLGFGSVEIVRAGKYFEIAMEAETGEQAEQQLELMCRKLLANPVIEQFRFDVTVEATSE